MDIITKAQAKAQGLKHYFTGLACKHGHVSERFASTKTCYQCYLVRQQTPEYKAYDAKRKQTPEYKAQQAEYRQANPERYAAYNAAYNKAYQKANLHIKNAQTAKRKAAKLQATPLWVDFEAIKAIYKQCAERTRITGIPHAVDHILPLQGKKVCGLHVAANLQILSATDNLKKSNKLLPMYEMPV
jgi:hypothetical protein